MKIFLKDLKRCRNALRKNRKKFWQNNKNNFEKNIQKIIKTQKLPKGWKIYFIASNFLSYKGIMPYEYEAWSIVNLVGATKKQGFEIMVFLNKAKSFLSLPGLLHIVIHELAHVNQVAKNPKKQIKFALNDKYSKSLEIDAEKQTRKIVPEEFWKQEVLEFILYCYDNGGWKASTKMVDFLYKKRADVYSGGYDKGITKKEYEAFMLSKRKRDINIFIDYF